MLQSIFICAALNFSCFELLGQAFWLATELDRGEGKLLRGEERMLMVGFAALAVCVKQSFV